MYLIFAVGLHNLAHLVANSVLWVFYHFEFSCIERYKTNDRAWPWYEDPVAWRKLCHKSIALLIFNGNVAAILATWLIDGLGLLEFHSMKTEDLPDTKTLMMTITFFMMVDDFAFYFAHKFLHWRVIYPYIHKIHH